jgi:hypothetical protein
VSKWLTKEEIVEEFLRMQTDDSIRKLRTIPKGSMILYHAAIGSYIRNQYKLWDRDNPLTKQWFLDNDAGVNIYLTNGTDNHPNHPDEVSMSILYMVWDQANEFWEKVKQ